MVTVALAGATSGFGLTMLRTFIYHNKQLREPHKLVLLSRSAQPKFSEQGVDVRPVDYSNHSQLVQALSGVHTVELRPPPWSGHVLTRFTSLHQLLSTVGGDPVALKVAQIALVKAAQEAGVKRFAPSEYAGQGYEGIDLYSPKAEVWEHVKASGLEYTRFSCGLFMSVLATGTPKPMTSVGVREGAKSGEEEALAGLRPWNFVVNMKAGTADLPADGTAKVTWTDMRDVALFTFRALDLPEWKEDMGMQGDVKSFREVVEIVERVQARKFLIKENSIEEMSKKSDHPGKTFYNQVRVAIANGWCMVPDDLNKQLPGVKPVTCEEFVEKWWSGVRLGEPSWGEDMSFM